MRGTVPAALLMMGLAVPAKVVGVYSRRSLHVPEVHLVLPMRSEPAELNAPPLHSATVSFTAAEERRKVAAFPIVRLGSNGSVPAFASLPATQPDCAPVPQSQ